MFTVPRLLRPLFSRRRAWLGELCRIAARLLEKACCVALPGAKPAFIEFVQTFGDLVNFQPHVDVLCADGVFRADGTFVPLPPIPEALLERGFRRAVLDFLVRERAISGELCGRMLGWRYSGFSVHNQVRVAAEDAEGRKKLAATMLRAPLSLAKMSYDAASGTLNLPLEDAPWAQAQLPGDAGRPVAGAALQAYSRSLRATRQVRGLVLECLASTRAARSWPGRG